tara:strand:- start:417 stop:575 length:159 start_codon:yes stop_codon:yes gene_type:complete
MEVLSEIKFPRIVEPISKVFKDKKKSPQMLEEQIRDEVPQDLKSEEEKNEEV